MAEARKNDEARSPESKELDEPWTFGSLAKYRIPQQALPLVTSIYDKCSRYGDQLTIREALWMGRLHKMIELYHSRHSLPLPDAEDEAMRLSLGQVPEGYQEMKPEDLVLDWAYTYANWELSSEIAGEPFDSTELDGQMMTNVYEFYGERRDDFIAEIAEKYGDDEIKLKALNLSIGKTEEAAKSGKYKEEA